MPYSLKKKIQIYAFGCEQVNNLIAAATLCYVNHVGFSLKGN